MNAVTPIADRAEALLSAFEGDAQESWGAARKTHKPGEAGLPLFKPAELPPRWAACSAVRRCAWTRPTRSWRCGSCPGMAPMRRAARRT